MGILELPKLRHDGIEIPLCLREGFLLRFKHVFKPFRLFCGEKGGIRFLRLVHQTLPNEAIKPIIDRGSRQSCDLYDPSGMGDTKLKEREIDLRFILIQSDLLKDVEYHMGNVLRILR